MISTDNEASAKACVLMYYGVTDVSVANQFRQQAATYIDLILRGAKPGDLPVQVPTNTRYTAGHLVADGRRRIIVSAVSLTDPPQRPNCRWFCLLLQD